ncbi:MAG: DUF2007 domain-containing protein [Bacteroidales bacterium]
MKTIRLTTCSNAIEANMIKNLLENEGINCFLTNENFSTLMPGHTGMLGSGVQIIIDEDDLEKATKALESLQQNEEIICPHCNSKNIRFGLGKNKLKKIFVVILSLLSSTPFNNINNTYYCNNCKKDFFK